MTTRQLALEWLGYARDDFRSAEFLTQLHPGWRAVATRYPGVTELTDADITAALKAARKVLDFAGDRVEPN